MSALYGTKDFMRLADIKKKSQGDLVEAVKLAVKMANEIETSGKAMSRGYAARDVYQSNYSPIAAIFFERACELSGETDIHNIRIMASMNSVDDEDENAIESAYSSIPIEKQPASRRGILKHEKATTYNRRGFSELLPLNKVNVVKGSGPNFDMKNVRGGTIEVWKTPDDKTRIVYTGNPLPTCLPGEEKVFKIDDRRETWKMVDYIEVNYMMNLQPLYGTSITGFMYN